ncbi:MAG: nucleotidyltransferase family protein [Verrucomicrobia bacterium]|nr:nucleotidyltransferase family protein [Verrucomicrobiota bacterium]
MTDALSTKPETRALRTSGISMLPLIRDGSEISYVPLPPDEIEPGDVIVLQGADRLVAHRLIRKEREGDGWRLLEKGDHQFLGTWISGEALLGRAVEVRAESKAVNLDTPALRLRIRALRAWSDMEYRATSAYVRVRDGGRGLKFIKYPFMMLGMFLLPIRWVVYRALISVYSSAGLDALDNWDAVLQLFRALQDEEPHLPADVPAIDGSADILRQTGPHGLTPLAAALFCDRPGTSPVPAEALSLMKQARYRIALTHMSAIKLVRSIAPEMAKAGIAYAVIKGPVLQESLYTDLFSRAYGDVDIVVSSRDIDRAVALLVKEGYEVVGGDLSNRLLRIGHFHLALDAPGKGTPRVELHWSILDRANLYRIGNDAVLERARTLTIEGVEIKTLSAEDEFVYLCVHIAKHAVMNGVGLRTGQTAEWFCRPATGNRLVWFCDVFLLLAKREDELDWEVVRRRIEEWNVRDEVAEVLAVLGLLRPDSAAGKDAISRLRSATEVPSGGLCRTDRFLGSKAGQRLVERLLPMNRTFLFRPVRLLSLGRLLFPSPDHLLCYHSAGKRWMLAVLYVWHPVHMLLKIMGVASAPGVRK